MRLTQRLLFVSPIVLLSGLNMAVAAQAFEATDPLKNMTLRQNSVDHHPNLPTTSDLATDPLIPSGCACSRCIQSSQVLQGKLPAVGI